MIKKFLVLFLLVTQSFSENAPADTHVYGGTGIESIIDLLKTTDSTALMIGSTSSYGKGGRNIWLLNLNKSGDTINSRIYGEEGNEEPLKAKLLSDGNILIAAYSGTATNSIWFLKVDSKGDTLWTALHTQNEGLIGDFIEMGNGDIFATGFSSNSVRDNASVWVQKINKDGKTLFNKTYNFENKNMKSGLLNHTADDNLLIIGYTDDIATDTCPINLIKINLEGDTVWTKKIAHKPHKHCIPINAFSNNDSTVLIAADCFDNSTHQNLLLKVNNNGDTIWTKYFKVQQTLKCFCKLLNGNYLLISDNICRTPGSGIHTEIMWINNNGDSIYSNIYGPSTSINDESYFESIKQLSNGNILLSMRTRGSETGYDIYNNEIIENGDIRCIKRYGGKGYELDSKSVEFNDNFILYACFSQSFDNGAADVNNIWVFNSYSDINYTTNIRKNRFEHNGGKMKIYNLPGNEFRVISSSNKIHVSVFNALGRCLFVNREYSAGSKNCEVCFNLSDLLKNNDQNSIYYLQITDGNESLVHQFFNAK